MRSVIFFDGVCNLCNSSVDYVIKRDRRRRFRYATLQSELGQRLLAELGHPSPLRACPEPVEGRGAGGEVQTVLLLEGRRLYDRSTAALRILRLLGFPHALLYAFILVPRPIRDALYRWIARHRYRWFGTRAACRVPTAEEQTLFL